MARAAIFSASRWASGKKAPTASINSRQTIDVPVPNTGRCDIPRNCVQKSLSVRDHLISQHYRSMPITIARRKPANSDRLALRALQTKNPAPAQPRASDSAGSQPSASPRHAPALNLSPAPVLFFGFGQNDPGWVMPPSASADTAKGTQWIITRLIFRRSRSAMVCVKVSLALASRRRRRKLMQPAKNVGLVSVQPEREGPACGSKSRRMPPVIFRECQSPNGSMWIHQIDEEMRR